MGAYLLNTSFLYCVPFRHCVHLVICSVEYLPVCVLPLLCQTTHSSSSCGRCTQLFKGIIREMNEGLEFSTWNTVLPSINLWFSFVLYPRQDSLASLTYHNGDDDPQYHRKPFFEIILCPIMNFPEYYVQKDTHEKWGQM